MARFFSKLDTQKRGLEVERSEIALSREGAGRLVNAGERVTVADDYLIKVAVVNTKPELSIGLGYEENHGGAG